MVSCVLPSRGAWPLDRQMPRWKGTGRSLASKTLEWAGRPTQVARCSQGPKAEILIDFINLSPINLGRHMRAAACLPGPGLPTLATLDGAQAAKYLLGGDL